MRAVVTGGSGFIGSTLTERLLGEGHHVTVIDALTEYYDPVAKQANLAEVAGHPQLELVTEDLCSTDLVRHLDGADVVFHLAGQPGVRLSWSDGFGSYVERNVNATQKVLEAAKTVGTPRLVYASSSSVYGNAERYPTLETDRPEPFSPYGVTKLAGEHLCVLYAANWGVPTVSLRYFTVYGPRQRPDMAHHRLCNAALDQTPFPMFGDGSQERSFTYVADVVDATHRAGLTPDVTPGTVLNVSGREYVTLAQLIDLVGETAGSPVIIDRQPPQAGDAARTGGSTARIEDVLGWHSTTSLAEGVAAQLDWHRRQRS